ncbi:MAG TPA: hypothetical protein VMM85_01710, partial [Methylomirabilota bacterium]|nr:hypothetical protein [Methylomirabilota bacterium]
MSSWFDKLLEELQERQAEADAKREGRPFTRRERNVTPIDARGRGRGGRGNGDAGGGGRGGTPPPVAAELPWRRWALIGGGLLALLVILGLLGGVVNLVTDV